MDRGAPGDCRAGLSRVTGAGGSLAAALPHPEPPEPRGLTIVRVGVNRTDTQVPSEQRHGWVLPLGTLAGHGSVL